MCNHREVCRCFPNPEEYCSDYEPERPHGEWIFKNGKYRCTACGEKAIYVYPGLSTIPKAILTDFCPKCGVQMNAKQLEMIRKREGLEEE